MKKPSLKLSVLVISLALTACAGGGGGSGSGGGGGGHSGSTPTGGGGGGGHSVPVPMPSENPSASDSKELAPGVVETTNKFDKNDFGAENKQADHLNLKDAYDQGLDGLNVKVGVVDGEISRVNPALPAGIVDHGKFGTNNTTSPDHATAVALAIAGKDVNGNVLGIAKNAELHIANAASSDTTISRSGALRAMYALHNDGVRIINNSYGFDGTYVEDAKEYLNSADKSKTYIGQLKKLTDNNTLLVWAAGNNGSDQPTSEALLPLAEPELQKGFITVVGVDEDNKINNQSNKCGDAKNWCLAALWKYNTANIHATNQQEMNDFSLSNTAGTSMAAPQVTAAAALVLQKYPWMTNDELRTTILTTATDLGAKGVDSVYGWGLLNIGKAIDGPGQFAFGDFNANVQSGHYTFKNDINGSYGLIKSGNGKLELAGQNTYLGWTKINNGTLALSGSSISATEIEKNGRFELLGGKTGAVTNKGTFFSSDGIINGDYKQANSGNFETLIGSVTLINGTANLDGQLNFIGTKAGYIASTGIHDVIMARHINGYFSRTNIDDKLLLSGKTIYTADSVQLEIDRVSARQLVKDLDLAGGQKNQIAIEAGADALDKAFDKLDMHILDDNTDANILSFAAGAAKLQSISTTKNLLDSLNSLTGSIYSNGAAITSLVADRLNHDFLTQLNSESQAIIQFNHMNSHWKPSGLDSKQSTNTGLIGGAKKINESLTAGAVYAFQNTNFSQGLEGNRSDGADINTNGIMLGAQYQPVKLKGLVFKGSLGYSDYRNNVNRVILLGNESYSVGRKAKGKLWQVSLLTEKRFNINDVYIIPQVALNYDYFQQNAFTETGGLGYGLNANKLNKGILSGTFKVIGQYQFSFKNMPINVFGSLKLDHDFQNRQFSTTGGFNGMRLNTRSGYWDLPKTRWAIGTGVSVQATKKVNLGLSYLYENAKSHWANSSVTANAKIIF